MNFMYEIVTFLVVCLVVLPLIIGMGISLLMGLTGVHFYSVVIVLASFIWSLVYLLFYY